MGETELKHVIALLLDDANRLQQLEPNAGTEARIWIAKTALNTPDQALTKIKQGFITQGVITRINL